MKKKIKEKNTNETIFLDSLQAIYPYYPLN